MTLPTPDQPDNYTGNHTARTVRWVALQPGTTTTGHLIPAHTQNSEPAGTTYCTQYNRQNLSDLAGIRFTTPHGKRTVPPTEIPLPVFLQATKAHHHGKPVQWCTHCLTMLAVEAEMIGQRAYPVKRLLAGMDKTTTS